ncbi:Laccase-8 [Camellia lanceoleosa]|uniref:Laccase-8 n=1 Tax=Camellia lanceoleosa TaxID=1840588 RepID=A0ACC0HKR9_9ERIC|nr:Laccase-8 [Camellia lanceoleosa]
MDGFDLLSSIIELCKENGEWWNANIIDVENQALASGGPPNSSNAFTINGQPAASYYIATHTYVSSGVPDTTTSTTGIIVYENAMPSTPQMPVLLAFNDTSTAHKFYTSLIALVNSPHWVPVPLNVDEHIGPLGERLAASLNNASLQFNTKLSMMEACDQKITHTEAFVNNVDGIYTTDFPDQPPLVFDYTNSINNFNRKIIMTSKSTKVKKLKFNSTVEMVLQNTASLGFGNCDPINDPKKFNLVNPQARNTIVVPAGGWIVVRFQANNPGVWLMHCHMDIHIPWGLSMAFAVENEPTPSTTLPPPPRDLPKSLAPNLLEMIIRSSTLVLACFTHMVMKSLLSARI